jgi:hypothetical protein
MILINRPVTCYNFVYRYLQFYGDPSLPLQVHVIQKLLLHLPLLHRASKLQQLIRQCGLAMVNVRDDAEVPDIRNGHLAGQNTRRNNTLMSTGTTQ